jgi:hypothetical protein
LRNKVRNLTRKAIKSKEKEIAKHIKDNLKKFWHYTQSRMKTCRGISDLVIKTENGKEVLTNNDDEKAETLSKFFSSVFTNEGDGDIPRLNTHDIKEKLGRLIVTEETVLKRLRELNISKSPGPDNIHPRILHDLSEALCIPTTIIFNTSLATKTIPDDWKDGCITAIFKKGSRKHASNYRPVSLTCILCKLLESFVRDHIVSHMTKNGLFSNRQYGFLSGRSTTLQLLCLGKMDRNTRQWRIIRCYLL